VGQAPGDGGGGAAAAAPGRDADRGRGTRRCGRWWSVRAPAHLWRPATRADGPQVERWHGAYVQALQALYDRFKDEHDRDRVSDLRILG
jgi:hypothetical protein